MSGSARTTRKGSLLLADQAQMIVRVPPAIIEGISTRKTINTVLAGWTFNGTFSSDGMNPAATANTRRRYLAYPAQLSFAFVTTGGAPGVAPADTIGTITIKGGNHLGDKVSEQVAVTDTAVAVYRSVNCYRYIDSLSFSYTSGGTPATDEVLAGVGYLVGGTTHFLRVPVPVRLTTTVPVTAASSVFYTTREGLDCFCLNTGGATVTDLVAFTQAPVTPALASNRQAAFDGGENAFRVASAVTTQPTSDIIFAVSIRDDFLKYV